MNDAKSSNNGASISITADVEERLNRIFLPYASRQREKLINNETRFVHYTSAEAGLRIIKTKRLWMRNVVCMTDYTEVQHGFQLLNKFFLNPEKKGKFAKALDSCFSDTAKESIDKFNELWNDIHFNTYVTSISEHDNAEDQHGRLSMWRAFGGNSARVAIVFRVPRTSPGAGALKITFSPVAYLSETQSNEVVEEVIANVHANCEFLRSQPRQIVLESTVVMLILGVTCLKHEGFREEREWRAIYSPERSPSPLMERSTQVINGVPQIVFELPLDVSHSDELAEIDLFRMFDRVIIGPSPYPWPIYRTFVEALKAAGVADAENRVFASTIPIRA